MANHASHAALPYPIKGARFTVLVPLLDADGDPTAQTTPDTEISEDNAAATDAAEEVSATSGMDGMGMITFSGAETDCSTLAVNFKAASGPKATLMTLYPRVLAEVGTGTLSAGSAGGGTLGTLLTYDVTGCFLKTTGGTGGGGTGGANNQVRKIATYNTSTGAFTVVPNWETTPSTDTTYAVLLPEGVTLGMLKTLNPSTAGRTLQVESDGMAYADAREWLGGTIATPTVTGVPEVDVTHWIGTAAATPTVAGVPEVDVTHLNGVAQSLLDLKDFADDGYDPSTNKVQGVVLVDTLTTYTGNTVQTGDSFARLGAPAGASVSADIAAIEAQTDDIGAAGAGLTAIPWNAAWDAEVESEATDALNAYDPPTRAELTSDINSVLAYLDGLVIAKGTIGATGNTTTTLHLAGLTYGNDEINNYLIAVKDVSTGEWHARYIEDWADAGDLATVATLPFTPEASVDLYVVLAFRQDVTGGAGLDAAGVRAAIGMASANLDTQLSTIDTVVDAILVDTAEIGAAGAGLTSLGGMSATMRGQVQTEAEDALVAHRLDELLNADSDIDGAAPPTVGSVFHELMTKTAGSFTFDQATDSLEALRDNTGTAGAGLTAIDLPDQTMNITGNITGNLSGSVGSVTGSVGGNVTGSVGSVATGGITRASFAADTGMQSVRSGTAQAGGVTTITLDAGASSLSNFYRPCLIYLTGGTGAGQVRQITSYNGTTKVADVRVWDTTPDGTTTFAILPEVDIDVQYFAGQAVLLTGSLPTVAVQGTVTANVTQISGDSTAADSLEAILDGTGGVTLVASAITLTTPITANVTQLSGDATAADNAEAFFDGTGYAGTNNVIPTVTTTTNLTNLPAITANWLTAAGLAADAVAEIQSGLATAANVSAVEADTQDIQSRLPAALAGGRMDSNVSAINNSAAGVAGLDRATRSIVTATVGAGSTTTSIVLSSVSVSAGAADCWKGLVLKFPTDTATAALRGQGTDITANTSGATPTLTVTALTTAPASGDVLTIE